MFTQYGITNLTRAMCEHFACLKVSHQYLEYMYLKPKALPVNKSKSDWMIIMFEKMILLEEACLI